MNKKSVLISRLQEQYQQGADDISLLNTALLLIAELQYSQAAEPSAAVGKVSVIMPRKPFEVTSNGLLPEVNNGEIEKEEIKSEIKDETLSKVMHNNILPELETGLQEEPTVEPEPEQPAEPETDEPAEPIIEPELEKPIEPISEPEVLQTSSVNSLAEEKYNDVMEEIPTLAQQQPKVVFELNDTHQSEEPSINDKLKTQQSEPGNQLQSEPIRDLRKAIGINDKYTFIRELFRNDEAAYERTIKTINNFNTLTEAEYWIQREMKYKLGWDDNSLTVKSFYQLVKRRFS